jgi:hypothetical protein
LADTERAVMPAETADLPSWGALDAAEFGALEETLLTLQKRARAALESVLGVAVG